MQASPSKARAAAVESRSWSLIIKWLQEFYHPSPIPSFERNATTLHALQELMIENNASDKLRQSLFNAQIEEFNALQTFEDGGEDDTDAILDSLERSLTVEARTKLNSLAESAVNLGCSTTTSASVLEGLDSKVLDLPRRLWAFEDQLASITTLIATLETRIQQAEQQIADLKHQMSYLANLSPYDQDEGPRLPPHHPTEQDMPDFGNLHAQTQQYNIEIKPLTLKAAEYQSRIDILTRQLTTLNPSSVRSEISLHAEKEYTLEQTKKAVDELEHRIKQFSGLPPDIEASRTEVRRAQGELDSWRRRRDELFRKL
jgi:HAUS augmin-like complex subunit 1